MARSTGVADKDDFVAFRLRRCFQFYSAPLNVAQVSQARERHLPAASVYAEASVSSDKGTA